MPSNNIGAPRIASGQATNQHVTSNDADNWLDGAITDPLAVIATSATVTLTATQFATHVAFTLTEESPGVGGAITLNVPSTNANGETLKRGFFAVINDTSQSVTAQVSGQAETPPTLTTGQRSILLMDGTNVYLAVPQGTVGADGVSAGLRWDFDTSTDTASDPGAGDMRLNNGTLASVTEVALSDTTTEIGNPDVSAFLATWDDSSASTKGHMIISKASAPQNFAVYAVTAATDATTHWRFTVIHVTSSGSFSAADVLAVQFVPKGDAGAGSTIAVANDGQSPSVVHAAADTLNLSDDFTVTDAGGGQVNVKRAFVGAVARLTASQIPVNITSATDISFDEATVDTHGIWSAGAPTRMTIPASLNGALVRVDASIGVSSDTADTWHSARIFHFSSADVLKMAQGDHGVEHGTNLWYATPRASPVVVATGDYFVHRVQTESDTSLSILGDANQTMISLEVLELPA